MNTHLPHGFDTLLEEVEVTVARQVTWPDHVTIETPELLHLRKNESQHELVFTDLSCISIRSYLHCSSSLKRSWRSTYWGKAANLLNILFITLSTGWSPWGASRVPEGVVILKRVLSCPRYHHLQRTRQQLSLQLKGNLTDFQPALLRYNVRNTCKCITSIN